MPENVSILISLRRFLNRTPNGLEARLLAEVADALGTPAGAILRVQVASVNRIDRHASGREVLLYRIRRGKPQWSGVELFPLQEQESKLATVTFRVVGKEGRQRVEFWLVKGHVFSLNYDSPPHVTHDRDVRVEAVSVHVDPMRQEVPADAKSQQPIIDPDALTGWVRDWHLNYGLHDAREPVPGEERVSCLAAFDTAFPACYLGMLDEVDGFLVGDSTVFGVRDIYEVTLETGRYLLISELGLGTPEQRWLAVERGSATGEIFCLSSDGLPPESVGWDFRQAVERFLRRVC